ncbi:MAG TPA: hypothetical protein VK470_12390 [Bacteroidota bacterium]|nr:hypothetical protein [Bacteroidota bacterium]
MTCNDALKKMYLRDEELSEAEAAEVKRHCEKCAACNAEYARVRSSLNVIKAFRHQTPSMNDPLQLINSVIGQIEREARQGVTASSSESLSERVMMWLCAPRVRLAIAAMLVVMTASFIVEYTSAFVSLKKFEETVGVATSKYQHHSTAAGLDQSRLLEAARDFSKLIAGRQSSVALSENWVVMNKQSLERFLLLYEELKHHASELPPEFRAENPGLARLLETEQPAAQAEMLVRDREALIRELNALLPTKGK